MVAALQRELLERMAEAGGLSELRAMLPGLREGVDAAVSGLRGGRIPIEGLAISRRLSKARDGTSPTRRRRGDAGTVRPWRGAAARVEDPLSSGGSRRRAMGFLDGTETPDVARYEAMLREAADELMDAFRG